MVAICPGCHDAVTRGDLRVSDETAYAWKAIQRPRQVNTAHLYVEPGPSPGLFAGQIVFRGGNPRTVIFGLSEKHRLGFRVIDGDILLVNLAISGPQGEELLRVTDGHVRVQREGVDCEIRPGMIEIPDALNSSHVPIWAREKIRSDLGNEEESPPLLRLEVIGPSLVHVEGCWIQGDRGIFISDKAIHFIGAGKLTQRLQGSGESTIVEYQGPMTSAVLSLGSRE